MLKFLIRLLTYPYYFYQCKVRPVDYARKLGVNIGSDVRIIGMKVGGNFGSEPYLIKIGDHVTLADSVKFVTHDGGVWVFREKQPNCNVFGTIEIGNNVFIGLGTIILPNVKIGDNVIIGAGSVVSKSIPSGSVAAGVPAKVIKSIDDYYEKCSKKLVDIQFKNGAHKEKYLKDMFKL